VSLGSPSLLIGAVGAVGVLHTMVPDHWVPISILARQRGWSKSETARAALQAGVGHVVSTLALGLLVWAAGVAVAPRLGIVIDKISSVALIGFGLWIAVSAWHEQQHRHTHQHNHEHEHGTSSDIADGRKGRAALLLIVGSSPMVEGIPAFLAAWKYGFGLIAFMAVIFAASTIATYILLCVSAAAGLRRFSLGALGRYGEFLSGLAIAIVGFIFWPWHVG
jgi:hypothetical protein